MISGEVLQYSLVVPEILHEYFESSKVPLSEKTLQQRTPQCGNRDFGGPYSRCFRCNRKRSSNGNLGPKSELIILYFFKVALLPTQIVDRKNGVFNFLQECYVCQIRQLTGSITSFRCQVALKATGMSALKVDKILIALQATVDRNVNFYC